MNNFNYIRCFYNKLVFIFLFSLTFFILDVNSAESDNAPKRDKRTDKISNGVVPPKIPYGKPLGIIPRSTGMSSPMGTGNGTEIFTKKNIFFDLNNQDNINEKSDPWDEILKQNSSKVEKNSISIMETQRNKILNLENVCTPEEENIVCGSITSSHEISTNTKTDTQLNFGYVIDKNVSLGLSMVYTPPYFSKNQYVDENNLGFGAHAILNFPFFNGTSAYLKPSIGLHHYHLNNPQDKNDNVISSNNDNSIKGLNLMLKFGQNILLPNDIDFNWYIGGGHLDIMQHRYLENKQDFLVLYNQSNYRATSAYLGADVNIPITENFKWKFGISAEHDFNTKYPVLKMISPNNSHVFINQSIKLARTRAKISSGLSYNINKHLEISITPNIKCIDVKNYKDWKWNFLISLSGRF